MPFAVVSTADVAEDSEYGFMVLASLSREVALVLVGPYWALGGTGGAWARPARAGGMALPGIVSVDEEATLSGGLA